MSLERRLRRESLEKELAQLRRNYEAVEQALRIEQNPVNQNSYRDQLEALRERIDKVDRQHRAIQVEQEVHLLQLLKPYAGTLHKIIRNAYRDALPKREIGTNQILGPDLTSVVSNLASWPHEDDKYSALVRFVSDLAFRPPGDDKYSALVRFVGYLTYTCSGNATLMDNLRLWLETEVQDIGALRNDISREIQDQGNDQQHPCLLVVIRKQNKKYFAKGWIVDNPETYDRDNPRQGCREIILDNKREFTIKPDLSDAPEVLKLLRDQCVKEYCVNNATQTIKQIHVFLPQEQITKQKMDSWISDDDEDFPSTMGQDHEVLIRYTDRLDLKLPEILLWRMKAESMRRQNHSPSGEVFVSIESTNAQQVHRHIKKEHIVAVKLFAGSVNDKTVKLLYKAGIPLALWSRPRQPNPVTGDELGDILEACNCLRDLPSHIRDCRCNAEDNSHIGAHLNLLWDDPRLTPPSQPLTQANLQGGQ